MTGFYRMARGWLDHPVFGNSRSEPLCRRAAWAWLVEHAVYVPNRVSVGSKIVELKRGQLSYSLRYLATAWGWSHEKVRRYLRCLQTETMIETDNETGQIIISICNYEKYQSIALIGETPIETVTVTPPRQTRDSSETNKKEGKEVERKKERIPPTPQGGFEGVINLPIKGGREYEVLWETWPKGRRTATAETLKKYLRAIKKERPEVIQEKAERWLHAHRNTKTEYIPLLITWLNQERWNDEIVDPAEKPKQEWVGFW